jgi:hypothetical protein
LDLLSCNWIGTGDENNIAFESLIAKSR